MNRRLNYKKTNRVFDRFHFQTMNYWIALRILDLRHPTSKVEVKKKYRFLLKHYHPDKKTGSLEIMKAINVANDYLENLEQ